MKVIKSILVMILVLSLTTPGFAGNGPGGPGGGGNGGGGGGGKGGATIPDTGTLYGDLYVILRDEGGVPVLDANGCIQPISAVDNETVAIYDSEGTLLFESTAFLGEPFALAFYTDELAETDVACELTEEMADWVQTVDFGRLNLGRAPASVIAHAFDEAVNKMNVAQAMYLDPAGRLVLTLVDEATGELVDKTIDAPAENLALYIEMMTDGDWITEDTTPIVNGGPPDGVGPAEGDGPSTEPRPVLNESAIGYLEALNFTNLGDDLDGGVANIIRAEDSLNNDELLLAASLLAAAADKTGSITLDKVIYINFIYGINQVGGLGGELEGKTYFNFGGYAYDRDGIYGARQSGDCLDGWVWVLQPELAEDGSEVLNHFVTTCMELLGYDPTDPVPVNSVHFVDMVETYSLATDASGEPISGFDFVDNVRAFTQAADDALQVIEYIHNYKVPEVLYPSE